MIFSALAILETMPKGLTKEFLRDLVLIIVKLARGQPCSEYSEVGKADPGYNLSAEHDEVLLAMSRQLAQSIFSHTVSLDLTRQWDAFSPFSSFVINDLKCCNIAEHDLKMQSLSRMLN